MRYRNHYRTDCGDVLGSRARRYSFASVGVISDSGCDCDCDCGCGCDCLEQSLSSAAPSFPASFGLPFTERSLFSKLVIADGLEAPSNGALVGYRRRLLLETTGRVSGGERVRPRRLQIKELCHQLQLPTLLPTRHAFHRCRIANRQISTFRVSAGRRRTILDSTVALRMEARCFLAPVTRFAAGLP